MPDLKILATFNNENGSSPSGSVLIDAASNLFGTTSAGGPDGDGTVFELAKTGSTYSATPTVIASFEGTSTFEPVGGLFADATGNLLGATTANSDGNGVIFEIRKAGAGYDSTPKTIVSFDVLTTGYGPNGDLVADAAGNLYGTTSTSVFEIAKTETGYSDTPIVLADRKSVV